jgi:hypothetical protein
MKRLSIDNRARVLWPMLWGILLLPGCISVSSSDHLEVGDFAFCVNKMQEGGKAPDEAATFCAGQFGTATSVEAERVGSNQ